MEIAKPSWKLLFFVFVGLFFSALAVPLFSRAQINFGDNPNFDPDSPGVKVIIVAPPGVFTLLGSETTNFTRVCTLGEALNIVLDVAGKNKIEFQEPIVDMCDNETIENLDQYFQMDKVGEVTVRSDSLPYLKDKSAQITMRDLPFETEPDIEVDGRLATDQDIENKSWDQSLKTLTFEAEHFTTYKAVAGSSRRAALAQEPIGEKQQPTKQRDIGAVSGTIDSFLILTILAVVLVVIGIAGYLVWQKKHPQ